MALCAAAGPVNGRMYAYFSEQRTWGRARDVCRTLNRGDLATFRYGSNPSMGQSLHKGAAAARACPWVKGCLLLPLPLLSPCVGCYACCLTLRRTDAEWQSVSALLGPMFWPVIVNQLQV